MATPQPKMSDLNSEPLKDLESGADETMQSDDVEHTCGLPPFYVFESLTFFRERPMLEWTEEALEALIRLREPTAID